MSSSSGSLSPPGSLLSTKNGNVRIRSKASVSGESSLFVTNDDFHGSVSGDEDDQLRPPGIGNDSDGSGAAAEELVPDQSQEAVLDDDNIIEMDPGILNNITDHEGNNQDLGHAHGSNSTPNRCARCLQISKQWHTESETLNKKLAEKDRVHNDKVKTLEAEIERLKLNKHIKWDPWADRLRVFLDAFPFGNPNYEDPSYLKRYISIYRDSCCQGIMSMNTNIVHPDLSVEVTVYKQEEIQDYFVAQLFADRYGLNFNRILCGATRSLRYILFPLTCTRLRPLHLLTKAAFKFESLPLDIRCRIWKLVIPNSELVHCLSRLDPCNAPIDFPLGKVSYPSRFHIGQERCSVIKADKPSRFLNYFRVSKKWYYVLAHLFYASNTLAFSSLGEFGRFCDGIGQSRVERLVNVELFWQGSLTPQQENKISLRKQPLRWLLHTHRLRTLVVHINESGKNYMRRPYEMQDRADYAIDFTNEDQFDERDLNVFELEMKRTDLQPNYRKNRSLRTVQGMEFVYQLRGMKWIRFYNTNAEFTRTKIRDWSFLQDVSNRVTQKKSDALIFKNEIENLPPLTCQGDFEPDDEIMELVKSFYDDTPVETVAVGGSDTSSNSSARSTVSGNSRDAESNDGFEISPYGSPRSPGGIHKPRKGEYAEVIKVDDDVEMGDDADHLPSNDGLHHLDIELSDPSSRSGRASPSVFDGGYDLGASSSLNTTVPSQSQAVITEGNYVIIIPDDDHNSENHENRRRRFHGNTSSTDGYMFVASGSCSAPTHDNLSSDEEVVTVDGQTSGGLFVRTGSCGAPTDNLLSSDEGVSTVSRQLSDRLFVPTGSCSAPTNNMLTSDEEVLTFNRRLPGPFTPVIDLTLDDDAMDVDDLDQKKGDENTNPYNNVVRGIKLEKPLSQGQSVLSNTESARKPWAPSEPRDPDLDDDKSISIRLDPFDTDGYSASKCSSKRSRDEDGPD